MQAPRFLSWDMRNTLKPVEKMLGSSGIIQPHFESSSQMTFLEKKHFTRCQYTVS